MADTQMKDRAVEDAKRIAADAERRGTTPVAPSLGSGAPAAEDEIDWDDEAPAPAAKPAPAEGEEKKDE